MSKKFFGLFCFVVFFFFLTPPLHAQSVPSGQDIGAQSSRFTQEVEKNRKQFEGKKVSSPKVETKEEEQPATPSASFILTDIKITGLPAGQAGMTVFKPENFKSVYQAYLGKSVSLKEIQAIANQIKIQYKRKGYLTSLVTIPQQDVKDGVVEIKVIEGRMGELKVEGNKWFSSDLIKKYFHLKKDEIFDVQKLEKDILRINKLLDFSAKSVLSPGKDAQTSDVTLKVEDHDPFHVGVNFDNHGTRLVGREQQTVTLRSSNLTGHGDSVYGSFLFGRREEAQSVTYVRPIDTYGTKVGLSVSHFTLRVGKEYRDFDMTGETKTITPFLTKELYLSEDFDAELNLGMDIKSIRRHTLGQQSSDDQLRIPYLGFDFTKNDSMGQTTVSPRFDYGASDFLGASSKGHPSAGRAGTGGIFEKYELAITRIQKMILDSYAIIRSAFQFSPFSLSSSEQMQIGGVNSVRGYPEGDYTADKGCIINFDWIFPMYLFPDSWKLPHAEQNLKHQIEPVFFVDWARGTLNTPLAGEHRSQILTGIGGGLKISIIKHVSAKVEWAKAVGYDKPISGSGPSTFYFSVQSEF